MVTVPDKHSGRRRRPVRQDRPGHHRPAPPQAEPGNQHAAIHALQTLLNQPVFGRPHGRPSSTSLSVIGPAPGARAQPPLRGHGIRVETSRPYRSMIVAALGGAPGHRCRQVIATAIWARRAASWKACSQGSPRPERGRPRRGAQPGQPSDRVGSRMRLAVGSVRRGQTPRVSCAPDLYAWVTVLRLSVGDFGPDTVPGRRTSVGGGGALRDLPPAWLQVQLRPAGQDWGFHSLGGHHDD